DLGYPIDLGLGSNNVTQERLGSLHVDSEVVIDKENCDLALLLASARFQQQQFVDNAFVGAEANGIAKKSGDSAELATVGAASSRLDGNNPECSPAFANSLEQGKHRFGYEIELVKIDRVPGD